MHRRSVLNFQIIFPLCTLAFVVWLIFLISVKVRQEFFAIETSSIELFDAENVKANALSPERSAALSAVILKNSEEQRSLKVIFSTGQGFDLPKQAESFEKFIEKKKNNILLTALLVRVKDPSVSRVKLWKEDQVSFQDMRLVMNIFSKFGFDDFDLAVERRTLP